MKLIGYRPTWVEVDLERIGCNLRQIKERVGKTTKVLAVVKQDAYGHGVVEVSGALIRYGVDYLGVASIDEGVQLRESGFKIPILILGSILSTHVEPLVRYELTQTLCTQEVAKALNSEAKRIGKKAIVHVKVDTGMGRLGVWWEEAIEFVKGLIRLKHIKIEGIYTHFPSADEKDRTFTSYQISCFKKVIEGLERKGIYLPNQHAANSIGLMGFRDSHFNMVRPGLMIYGVYPQQDMARLLKLKPALSLKTRIVHLKHIPLGRSISYGRTFVASSDTLVATLPIGYGDGYPYSLSNKGIVLVRGKRAMVVGRVCMDHIMIDVGHIKGVKIGDEVILIGKAREKEVKIEDLASLGKTIPYEILCGINPRIHRSYKPLKG